MVRVRWVTILLLCACNQVFGVEKTHPIDARSLFFDTPVDAPFSCPVDGSAPVMSSLLRQAVFEMCQSYSESSVNRRTACGGYDWMTVLAGQIDGAMSPVAAPSPQGAMT